MKNIHLSDVIDSKLLESFYTEYDGYCMNLHEGGFYVEWLNKEEFFERIKTYGDLVKIHISIGFTESVLEAYYLGSLPQEEPKQETLEEAAERSCESITHPYCDREKSMFIKGAKWQAERMYSETEVLELLRKSHFVEQNIEEWFEQHKKK